MPSFIPSPILRVIPFYHSWLSFLEGAFLYFHHTSCFPKFLQWRPISLLFLTSVMEVCSFNSLWWQPQTCPLSFFLISHFSFNVWLIFAPEKRYRPILPLCAFPNFWPFGSYFPLGPLRKGEFILKFWGKIKNEEIESKKGQLCVFSILFALL